MVQGRYFARKIYRKNQGSDDSEIKYSVSGGTMKRKQPKRKKTRKENQRTRLSRNILQAKVVSKTGGGKFISKGSMQEGGSERKTIKGLRRKEMRQG